MTSVEKRPLAKKNTKKSDEKNLEKPTSKKSKKFTRGRVKEKAGENESKKVKRTRREECGCWKDNKYAFLIDFLRSLYYI